MPKRPTSATPMPKPRLSRAEKRAIQRAANPARAAKMGKARQEILEEFNAGGRRAPAPGHYIGCSGWFYWDWRGKFYPENSQPNEWFAHYARRFNTVELNAPFYSWPTVANVKSWLRQAGQRNFIYTVKVSELITHVKRFKGTRKLVSDFGLVADIPGPRMGCLLFQLPPSYHYTAARLKAIVSQLEPGRRNVVEFRHKSWWNDKVYAAFKKAGVIFCSCSGPKLPDELIKTAEDIYVRFHGLEKWYRYDYSKQELEIWAKRIRQSKAKRAWIYFNNDYEAHAIKNARMLERLL